METTLTTETTETHETSPRRWTPGSGLGIALALGLAKLAVHLATTGRHGYGFFVDELYFLAASEHLAWGFLDFPPLLPRTGTASTRRGTPRPARCPRCGRGSSRWRRAPGPRDPARA
jgi:hypothetical protein